MNNKIALSLKPALKESGFTLIELIMGIVILAIAVSLLATLIFPQANHSVEPLQQMRGAELAQSLMNEIKGQAYDQHSAHNGGEWRCGETLVGQSIPLCTSEINYGPDAGETQVNYNDVDDYHTQGAFIIPSRHDGRSLAGLYPNFLVKITVSSDPSLINGSGNNIAKRIDLEMRLPAGDILMFSSYRWNY